MSEVFIAVQLVARLDALTMEDREAVEARIMQALGCDANEVNCPMVLFASTVVHDPEVAIDWLH